MATRTTQPGVPTTALSATSGNGTATLRIRVGGMSCSFCSSTISKAFARLDGVHEVHVSLAHEEALVRYQPAVVNATTLRQTLLELGYRVRDPDKVRAFEEREAEIRDAKRRLAVTGGLTLVTALLMTAQWLGVAPPSTLFAMPLLALATVFGPGVYILAKAYQSLRRGILNQHVLLEFGALAGLLGGALGFVGKFADVNGLHFPIAGFFAVAVFITTYHILSEAVSLSVRVRASRAVERLLELQPETALRLDDHDHVLEVPVDELALGDRVRVRPGASLPVDGTVVYGSSAVDESIVSGEPIAVDKAPGDTVVGGSLNLTGALVVRVDKVGDESFLRQVARSVEEARVMKPGILQLTDRVLAYYVPAVVAFALLALLLWTLGALLVTGHADPARALFAALAVFVLGYPCALGMAAPLAMIRGGGMAAERGIIMRSGAAFGILKDVTTVVFDKTGTLTAGAPSVTDVVSLSTIPEATLLSWAGSVEDASEHPLARAVVEAALARGATLRPVQDFLAETGRGVRGTLGDTRVSVGSPSYLADVLGADVARHRQRIESLQQQAKTVVVIGSEDASRGAGTTIIGLLGIADAIKADAPEALARLRERGMRPVMITGDNEGTAAAVAAVLGITAFQANVLPGDKARAVRDLQRGGSRVMFVGDGINDAPALAQADAGVALGAGTDIAIESADIVLTGARLAAVVDAIDIGRSSYRKTVQNLSLAFVFNGAGVPLAVTGLLQPVWAMAAMAASVSVVLLNSFGGRLVGRSAPATARRSTAGSSGRR